MITRIKPFSTYYKHYQLKTQEYNNSQRSLSQDRNGRLWVFSKNESLNYYDEKADEFLFILDQQKQSGIKATQNKRRSTSTTKTTCGLPDSRKDL